MAAQLICVNCDITFELPGYCYVLCSLQIEYDSLIRPIKCKHSLVATSNLVNENKVEATERWVGPPGCAHRGQNPASDMKEFSL